MPIGRVYDIICNTTGKEYVGSTERELKERLQLHEKHYKDFLKGHYAYVTSFEVLKGGDYDIVLIEEVTFEDKLELKKREALWIYTLDCVNKNVPGRTAKEWREANRESINNRMKEYREANRESILEKKRKYYEANKGKINKQRQLFYQANKDRIKEQANTKHDCPCGGKYTAVNRHKHLPTAKHQKWQAEQEATNPHRTLNHEDVQSP